MKSCPVYVEGLKDYGVIHSAHKAEGFDLTGAPYPMLHALCPMPLGGTLKS